MISSQLRNPRRILAVNFTSGIDLENGHAVASIPLSLFFPGALVFAGFEQVEYIVQESSSSVEVCIGLTGAISHPITISIRSISYLRTATGEPHSPYTIL